MINTWDDFFDTLFGFALEAWFLDTVNFYEM